MIGFSSIGRTSLFIGCAAVVICVEAFTQASMSGETRRIEDGVYIAPVYGTSLEVVQIKDGMIALAPVKFLEEGQFVPANAALVGSLIELEDHLTATWHDGSSRTGGFSVEGKCFSWGHIYCRVDPFSDNEVLGGRYVASATTPKGVVSSTLDVTFNLDGTYSLVGVGIIGDLEVVSRSVSGNVEKGRYELTGWTLRLLPSAGGVREYLSFPYDIWGKNDPIYLNGAMARKQ